MTSIIGWDQSPDGIVTLTIDDPDDDTIFKNGFEQP